MLATYAPTIIGRGTDWIELAGDQCTLSYTGETTTIQRFNVCTNTQLPDFATGLPGGTCYGHRILPDGGELVACSSEIVRVNSSGAVTQTYPLPGVSLLFAINLDPDSTTFWTADYFSGQVFRVNIATGAIVTNFTIPPNSVLGGLAVVGERTAAIDPAIKATGASALSATEGKSFNGAVATFTDPDTKAAASEYSATINWGDGSASSAGTISGTGGTFTVSGSHTYAEEGSDKITVTITDVDNTANSAPASSTASVSDAALSATGTTFRAIEGLSTTAPVATFTDADPAGASSDYKASITWGDGTTTTGTIAAAAAGFQVLGTHAYAEEGSNAIAVTITDAGGASASSSSTAAVADARLSAKGVGTIKHATINGTVASFTDADPHGTLSDYTASINWGDGTTTTGTVTAANGKFNVAGSHHYKKTGTFHIKVAIKDKGGQRASASSTVKLSQSASAKLSGIPAACMLKGFTVTLSGKQISGVTFRLDGAKVNAKTVHRSSRYTALIALSPGSHQLSVKVTFRSSSHAHARTFHRSISGCPVIAPKFTG